MIPLFVQTYKNKGFVGPIGSHTERLNAFIYRIKRERAETINPMCVKAQKHI